jgi:hypothetical protein
VQAQYYHQRFGKDVYSGLYKVDLDKKFIYEHFNGEIEEGGDMALLVVELIEGDPAILDKDLDAWIKTPSKDDMLKITCFPYIMIDGVMNKYFAYQDQG